MAENATRTHDMKVAAIASVATVAAIALLVVGFFAFVSPAQASVHAMPRGSVVSCVAQGVCADVCPAFDAAQARQAAADRVAAAQAAEAEAQAQAAAAAAAVAAQSPQGAAQGTALPNTAGPGAQGGYCPAYPDGTCPYGGTGYGCGHSAAGSACGYCNGTGHHSDSCPYYGGGRGGGSGHHGGGHHGWSR